MNLLTQKLRIVVADDERDTVQFFQELLAHLGHEVVAVARTGKELAELCQATRPDLVITDVKMPDMDGMEAAAAVNRDGQVPVVLVTGRPDFDLTTCASSVYIMACLTKPVKASDLQGAITLAVTRFEQLQKVSREAVDLRQALEDRKVVERAKGIVVRRLHVDEEEAFRRLRRSASDRNRKLVEVARIVLEADEVFQALEGR